MIGTNRRRITREHFGIDWDITWRNFRAEALEPIIVVWTHRRNNAILEASSSGPEVLYGIGWF